MEGFSYTQLFLLSLLKVVIKSIAGGVGFAIIGLKAKTAWKNEDKVKLSVAISVFIFGIYFLFLGV